MIKKTNKTIPIDIESIIPIGVDNWYKSFEWPITWSDFVEIENEVKSIFNAKIDANTELADIIIINYKLYIEFSNYIFALLLKKEIGERATCSPKNKYYKSIFEKGIPLPIISFPKKPSEKGLKNKLRKIRNYLLDNKFSFPKFWKPRVYILHESRSRQATEYLKREYKGRIYPLSFFDFYNLKKIKPIDDVISDKIKKLAGEIRDELCLYMKSKDLTLTNEQKEFIFNRTLDLFTETSEALETVKKNLKKKIKLFMGCNNSYFSRIMSVAVRDLGGEIHGFTHGEPINYNHDLASWLDLSLNDYFYEYTETNSKILSEISRKFPPLKKNKCVIKSMNSNQYNGIFDNIKRRETNNISTVMFVGSFFKYTAFSAATLVFPTVQLFIELTLIYKLQSLGYKVIYKMHPGNLDEKIDSVRDGVRDLSVFEKLFPKDVEINIEKFESMSKQPDAFAFYYTHTSTFLSAFTSEKPIFLFDMNLRDYPEEMLDIIKKRCEYKLTKLNYI